MSQAAPFSAAQYLHHPPDFSLVQGGPLFQLLRRLHLADDALRLQRRRVLFFVVLAWVPLLLLATIGGTAYGSVKVPFLLDIEAHVRFLIAMPLLLVAEVVVHQRVRLFASHFVDGGVVPARFMPRFDDAIAAAVRLRNSVSAEVVLFIVVCVLGAQVVLREYLALDAGTWYATPGASGSTLTPAGVWYGYVSLPLFQFLLLRWYFRMLIWFQLMWRLSRIELHFVPTHPDQRAGLAFLGTIAASFAPLAVAHGALLAGHLASRIFHLGASLPEFKLEIAVMVVFMLLLALGPLLLFMPQLWRAKLQGERDYGALAQRYVNEFDSKWLRGATPPDEPLIGSADIQSLADLNNSFQTVRGMHVLPFGKDAILQLAIATIVPVAPLVLTMMPLDELAKRLFSVLF